MNRTPDLPGAPVLQQLTEPGIAQLCQQHGGQLVGGNGLAASGAVAGVARDSPPTFQPAMKTPKTNGKQTIDFLVQLYLSAICLNISIILSSHSKRRFFFSKVDV